MEILAVLFLGISAFLLLAELMIPSMGLLGLLALGALLLSYSFGFQVSSGFGWMLVWVTLGLLPITVGLGMHLFKRSPWGRRMVVAGTSFSAREASGTDRSREDLVGRTGRVSATLRPAGEVRFGDRRVSCVTRGEWIEAGVEVRVVGVVENTVLVERTEEGDALPLTDRGGAGPIELPRS